MKKLILISAMFTILLLTGLSMSKPAPPPVNDVCEKICAAVDQADADADDETCATICSTCTYKGTTDPYCACKLLEVYGILEKMGLDFYKCLGAMQDTDG